MANKAEMIEALINPKVTTGKGHPIALAVTRDCIKQCHV
jgi:hypothetical protein